ncbi:tRNA uridine-5-carboxymethylaminomethyl(34) synthesis GTPase MnmE [Dissulfurirhabdus thermomarina]|nr:tRNA uridine-5-carboxymethylaminomethyl(34) synthesis GTPase MnmE [Dissulfurirhabdus thermomarina]
MSGRVLRDGDTIAAVATPPGPGGIGIVRVSGPLAPDLLRRLFRPARPGAGTAGRRLAYGWVVDPAAGEVVDEALAVLMPAPRSYTREDVLEFQCHSGPAVLRRVLELVLREGARPAEPGEFTRRAFLNGRIDLAQAEAVLDLATARTEAQRRSAAAGLRGDLERRLGPARAALVQVRAELEAAIDHPEEDLDLAPPAELRRRLDEAVRRPVSALIRARREGRVHREGARVVLAGRPNAGKSSLFNALLGEDRVIVTPVPGTTRDGVEETISLGGIAVVLVDTAGIRAPADEVETLGVARAKDRVRAADLVVWVLDGSRPPEAGDREVREALPRDGRVFPVINKADLFPAGEETPVEAWLRGKAPPGLLPEDALPAPRVSALTGLGLEDLRRRLEGRLLGGATAPPPYVPNARQAALLEQAEAALGRAVETLERGLPPEITAVEVAEAAARLDEIFGLDAGGDILDEIFGRFCIGK